MKFELKDSTATALGASTSYTGTGFEVGNSDTVYAVAYADQAGTLYIDHSWDNVNFDVSDSVAMTASTGAKLSVNVEAPYARLRIVNGATAETTLRAHAGIRQ